MLIRFGYVAMSMSVSNASPSRTMTAAHFSRLADRAAALRRLERIAGENLHNTLRLLRHNRAHAIPLYRFSSKLIPLIGHELVEGWDPFPVLADDFAAIGAYVREQGMRVSFHPDHFTVLSTPRAEVLRHSLQDLDRHVRMLEAMGLDERAKCNIHIGGAYGDKPAAAERFLARFRALPERLARRITLENDDKTFTAEETLAVCERLGVPMVLDIHHHLVNPGDGDRPRAESGEAREESAAAIAGSGADEAAARAAMLWPRIRATWTGTGLAPKIHVSSPRGEKDRRGHADFVDAGSLLPFLRAIAKETPQLDVMLEAKRKDEALFRLIEDLQGVPGFEAVDQASLRLSGDAL